MYAHMHACSIRPNTVIANYDAIGGKVSVSDSICAEVDFVSPMMSLFVITVNCPFCCWS